MITTKILAGSYNPATNSRLVTYELTYPRIIHAEVMTHCMLVKNASSCLSGDTIITIERPSSKSENRNFHRVCGKMTIKEICDKWFNGDSKGRSMRQRMSNINLRCLNEETGEFITTKIENCFRQGLNDVYEIELTNGYKLKCTENHRLLTDEGWRTLKDINIFHRNGTTYYDRHNFKLVTNGLDLSKDLLLEEKAKGKTLKQVAEEYDLNYKHLCWLCEKYDIFWKRLRLNDETFEYKNKEWLEDKLKEGLFSSEIAKLCNTTSDRVKKSIKKCGLRGNAWTWGSKDVWNKGLTYKIKEESLVNTRKAAKGRIKKESYKNYENKHPKDVRFRQEIRRGFIENGNFICAVSGNKRNLQLHHIIPVWMDSSLEYEPTNLIPLNNKIHRLIHGSNLELEFIDYHKNNKLHLFCEDFETIRNKAKEINKPVATDRTLVPRYFAIKNVKYIGVEETYDIEVTGDYHNFIANGLVVHNSRAIPARTQMEEVRNNPFIPHHWQKSHSGMQGSNYFTDKMDIDNLVDWWMYARDYALTAAENLFEVKCTKQIINRLLEPFSHITVIISGTEWENFFNLRCPKYAINGTEYRSLEDYYDFEIPTLLDDLLSEEERRNVNKGMAEIHLMELAEKMWNDYNNCEFKTLLPGEWHIPVKCEINNLDEYRSDKLSPLFTAVDIELMVKMSTAACARGSYGKFANKSVKDDLDLFDSLLRDWHASPFSHASRCPTKHEIDKLSTVKMIGSPTGYFIPEEGWFSQMKGFIPLRWMIENNLAEYYKKYGK